MAERPETLEIRHTGEPHAKLRLYAAYVRGIHERVAALFTLLTEAGPEVGAVLDTGEQERLTAVSAFVAHLADSGALGPHADQTHLADALWALTGPQLYTQLTAKRGWSPDRYEHWLADTLIAVLLPLAPRKP